VFAGAKERHCSSAIIGDDSNESACGLLQLANERLQTCFQCALARLRQIEEAERLKPALSGPHGKQHFRFFVDGGVTQLEDDLDPELFVERLFQVHQPPGGGKLMEFAAQLAPVGQSNQHEHRPAQLNAKRPLPLLNGGLRN